MVDINVLKETYFFQLADAQKEPEAPVPQTFSDSKITPIIDCVQFSQEIEAALGMVGQGSNEASNAGDFVYIANWCLGLSGGLFTAAKILGPDLTVIDAPGAAEYIPPFTLDGPGGTKNLLAILKQLAQKGVDVRVLGWVSLSLMDTTFIRGVEAVESMVTINALTLQSIVDLRTEPRMAKKTVMSVIAHAAAGVHTKCVIVGTNAEAIGFTGGLDFHMGRWANVYHAGATDALWHDAVAKIEGPAVVGLYEWYRDLWNENVTRPPRRIRFEGQQLPTHLGQGGELKLGEHAFQTPPKGKHHAQNLRTVPRLNYKPIQIVPTPRPITFAPNGLFEFRYALRKAILNAQIYIYMEDQSFWSQEIMEWINSSIVSRPALRVVLLAPGGADPNDPAFPDAILCNSINEGLLKGVDQSERDRIRGQVRMFKRVDEHYVTFLRIDEVESGKLTPERKAGTWVSEWVSDPNGPHSRVKTVNGLLQPLPMNALAQGARHRYELRAALNTNRFSVVGNEESPAGMPIVMYVRNLDAGNSPGSVGPTEDIHELVLILGITVHSKTTLIDDHWAFIGSANIMRRSLYTDIEHCVSVLDEENLMVKEYRKTLWDEHFRHGIRADFDDIQAALHAWEPSWGLPGSAPSRPSQLERVNLPIDPNVILEGKELRRYNRFQDADSREKW